MNKIVQCAPNFSEGRDINFIRAMEDIAQSDSRVTLMDASYDADHNRSGFYLLGPLEPVSNLAFELIAYATDHIDMTQHEGGHPRMGATDVVPFIPIQNATMEDCIRAAEDLSQRVWEELEVPVFLYGEAAKSPERENLANIRRGQFEGMAEKIQEDEWAPDFGQARIHPTAGVVAIGARTALISLNVNLATKDLDVAKKIAQTIRESGGGLRGLKAIALEVEGKEEVQVSTTIADYEALPLYRVLEFIKTEAAFYGVGVSSTEVYGTTPAAPLIQTALYYLKAQGFDPQEQLIENHLRSLDD